LAFTPPPIGRARTTVLLSRMRTFRRLGVETGIVELCRDDVFHRAAGRRFRNQRANQQARYRCVSIRKMEDVGFGRRRLPASPASSCGKAEAVPRSLA